MKTFNVVFTKKIDIIVQAEDKDSLAHVMADMSNAEIEELGDFGEDWEDEITEADSDEGATHKLNKDAVLVHIDEEDVG
jgi:hypothetical protein